MGITGIMKCEKLRRLRLLKREKNLELNFILLVFHHQARNCANYKMIQQKSFFQEIIIIKMKSFAFLLNNFHFSQQTRDEGELMYDLGDDFTSEAV